MPWGCSVFRKWGCWEWLTDSAHSLGSPQGQEGDMRWRRWELASESDTDPFWLSPAGLFTAMRLFPFQVTKDLWELQDPKVHLSHPGQLSLQSALLLEPRKDLQGTLRTRVTLVLRACN